MTFLLRRPLRSIVPALHQWHRAASSTTNSTRKTRKKNETSEVSDSRIAPGSENHHDLPSFLAYAERVDLSPKAPVFVGTHYEYTVATTLARLGFKLTRTGRARDYGIDLLGSWTLPVPVSRSADAQSSKFNTAASPDATDLKFRVHPPSRPLRVLLQCKYSNRKLGPEKVRELEGAFTGAPTEWRQEDFLGLLVTTNSATRGIIEALGRSRWPMGFLKIEHDGRIEQFLWNRSAQARGLEGLGVTVRYMLPPIDGGTLPTTEGKKKAKTNKGKTETVRTDVGLTWDGMPLPYLKSEDIETLEGLKMEEVELVEAVQAKKTRGRKKMEGLKMEEVELVEAVQAKAEQEGLDVKVKKTRGRKKKSGTGEELNPEEEEPKKPARRGGRKKKDAQPDAEMANEELVGEVQEDGKEEAEGDDETPSAAPVVKRGRGRPRKV